MAVIEFLDLERVEYLREYHTMGRRTEAVDSNLDYPFISKLHAVLEWRNPNWMIRDVSHNGIWVNGHRIEPQTNSALKLDDLVELAGSEGVRFKISNIDKPQDMVYQIDNISNQEFLIETLLLPNEQSPEIGLFKCPERLQWFSEEIKSRSYQNKEEHNTLPHEQGPYYHGDTIDFDGKKWCFFLTHIEAVTTEFRSEQEKISGVNFRFDISQDEETTTLTLNYEHNEFDLGERSHHYLLVHLLRHKLSQINATENITKVTADNLGWIDCQLIEKELGIDESHLNIQIFRARKQISSELAGYSGVSKLIQRRRGSIRIGIDNFSIYKEGVLEK